MKKNDCYHLVAYVKTSRVTDWKRIAFKYLNDGKPVFVYRSDDEKTFAKYAQKGAILWVIESHPDKPSLVARMKLIGQVYAKVRANMEIIETTGCRTIPEYILPAFEYGSKLRWYAFGDPENSCFFGHNNVATALMETELAGNPAPWLKAKKWIPKFGQSLQRPRRILSGQENLEKFAQTLSRQSVFLSWKHNDFKDRHDKIREIVNALVDRGLACWWDLLALPRSRALKRLFENPHLLQRLLDYGLAESSVLLVLGSKNWGTPSTRPPYVNWTRGEWDRSKTRFVYEIDCEPKDNWPNGLEKAYLFKSNDPLSKIINGISRYFIKKQ